MPTAGWKADLVNNGELPEREERVFAFEVNDNSGRKIFHKLPGTVKLKEVFVTGYGLHHRQNRCRTWDGRSPLQYCKFPFKVHVSNSNLLLISYAY